MSNNINPDELQKALNEYLKDYADGIEDDVQASTDTTIKNAKEELVRTSPRSGVARNTKYNKGWAIKKRRKD